MKKKKKSLETVNFMTELKRHMLHNALVYIKK